LYDLHPTQVVASALFAVGHWSEIAQGDRRALTDPATGSSRMFKIITKSLFKQLKHNGMLSHSSKLQATTTFAVISLAEDSGIHPVMHIAIQCNSL
jgi:hypothetical protein